jgi:multidrug/hemolysin transport system ATP-binding protein
LRQLWNIFIDGGDSVKNIIEIKNISKTFKDIKAVSNLSFTVKEGELFAFLGVNGAGKSTTINMICGELAKDSGEIIIDGLDLESNIETIKGKIGVVFQNSLLDLPLTVYDNLESRAALYGIVGLDFKNRLNELSELLDLKDLLKRKLKNLSGGQRRRIDIARALLHRPQILILDEPTTGLDPQTRKTIWNIVSKLRKEENMTVFLTTHYMEEAADADYVVIIDSGKISAKGTPLELKNQYTGDFITIYGAKEEVLQLGLKYEVIKDAYRIYVSNTEEATKLIIKYPHIFVDCEITKGKMDDVFLAVTGKKLGGGDL